MTRRRINTVEEADAAMAKLGWLRTQATPNAAVRELWDVASAYRAEIHRLQKLLDGQGTGHFQRMVKTK
jgi:hypothetical protein